jgi:hypothetical protein
MASMATRIPLNKLNVARQAIELKRWFPNSTVKLGPGRLTWVGRLTPTPLSTEYTVEIVYQGFRRPVITILSPQLAPLKGSRLRHVFSGDHPCVHFHDEWDASMSIAATIVPWTAEWLLHHEIFVATGRWTGGGHEPGVNPKRVESNKSGGGLPNRKVVN